MILYTTSPFTSVNNKYQYIIADIQKDSDKFVSYNQKIIQLLKNIVYNNENTGLLKLDIGKFVGYAALTETFLKIRLALKSCN